MPGQLIDVGGHRLHLHCTGSGSPTVVLETGLGETSSSWGWIAPAVARGTKVCVYDRAGRGWSESAARPLDGNAVANDLHTLLNRGQVDQPYVLVGHSLGGLYALSFAVKYNEKVAGMVLLDATSPEAFTGPAQRASRQRPRANCLATEIVKNSQTGVPSLERTAEHIAFSLLSAVYASLLKVMRRSKLP
jgi:pimeloyl-ACP methyl ester carboxylesterase